MFRHVLAAKVGLTSCVLELTFNLLEGTFLTQVPLKVLALDFIWCTVVGAGDRVAFTLWPVVSRYIMEGRLVVIAVFTAECSLWAFLGLVVAEETTLETLPTAVVAAFHFYKGTPLELRSRLRINIQVFLKHFQLSPPLTPVLMVGAVDLKQFQYLMMGVVVYDRKARCIAKRAAISRLLNALDTLFTKVTSAAADEVGRAKDQHADGALSLEVTRRWVDELTLVSEAVFQIPAFVTVGVGGSHNRCSDDN